MSEEPAEPRGVDQARAAAAVRELLFAVGEDPDRPGRGRSVVISGG